MNSLQEAQGEGARTPGSRLSLAWIGILLCAVLAHLPALRGFFFQDDWPHLARAMGRLAEDGGWARPLSRLLGFRLGWAFFGFEAAAWHALALLVWGLTCWLIYRVGQRLGLGTMGSGLAAIVAATSPAVITPIFWVSASSEVFAVFFGLAAIYCWLDERRFAGIAALFFALLSVFTKESLLALPLLVALLTWSQGAVKGRGRAQAAWVTLGMAAGALLAAGLVWKGMAPKTPYDPYAMGGPGLQMMNLGLLGVWLISPWRFSPIATPGLPWLGLLLWAAWAMVGFLRARAGDRRMLFWCAWGVLALAPILPLERHLQPYYLLGALPAYGWTLGYLLELLWPEATRRRRQGLLFLLVFGAVASAVSFTATRARLESRDERGSLLDPMAKRSAVAFESYRLVRTLPLEPGRTLAVLAATYTEWPEAVPAELAQRLNSPVHAAIGGVVGLRAMARPEIRARWDSHLDQLRADALVLFDNGGPRLKYWGRVENARLYSALVAVAARQYSRAMHDLWVVGGGAADVSFVYDAGLMPIPPEHLDDTGPSFVRYVLENEENEATALRLVLLFEQIYEAVRGQKLPVTLEE